jgi:AraC-like DNA-binding protein
MASIRARDEARIGPRRTAATPRYEESPASAALSDHVACCWSFEIPDQAKPFHHALIPDGAVSLVLVRKRMPSLQRLTVTVPCATARWLPVSPGDTFLGVRLLPGASLALLGIAPHALRGPGQPLAALSSSLADALLGSLATAETPHEIFAAMARALEPLAARAPPDDPIIRRTVAELLRTSGNPRICELAQDAGISERQLRRRFSAAVGLTPKQLSRTLRVRNACIRLVMLPSEPLARIAHEIGYADQAHFSREFSEVFGSPAGGLAALIRGYQHSRFVASAALEAQDGRGCPIRSRRRAAPAGIHGA